jgi:hypothetical protein
MSNMPSPDKGNECNCGQLARLAEVQRMAAGAAVLQNRERLAAAIALGGY